MAPRKKVPPVNQKNAITNFFTSKGTTANFYRNCLLENCTRKSCSSEKASLREQIKLAKAELTRIQKAVNLVDDICDEKDKKIELMRSKLASSPDGTTTSIRVTLPFQDFANIFSENELQRLRSIDMAFSADSTFVLNVTRSIFKENLSELENATIRGQGMNNTKKTMDSNKLKIITDMFGERMSLLKVDESERMKRKKRLNTLLNRAIGNINKANQNEVVDNAPN